jgi:predicted alpha/beta-hydrolase family hydrolase
MSSSTPQLVTITVDDATRVSGLLQRPTRCSACFVMAHGAGAGMQHPFMAATAHELARLGIATLRYQFPYMERKSRRPDPPALCHATVQAAVRAAAALTPTLPLIAGGKSFGARMTSQAQAASALPGVRGLAFFGFPLHPPKRPAEDRGAHLRDVHLPMLFLQGTRDELADLNLLGALIKRLGAGATLKLLEHADHSFHVLVRSGRTDAQVQSQMLEAFAAWTHEVVSDG